MKKYLAIIAAATIFTGCCGSDHVHVRQTEDFNFGWLFTIGDDDAYSDAGFDDSSWRKLHLPHDWAIEGEFSNDNPATYNGGALPGGIGWYRKHFATPDNQGDNRVNVEFDGVFMNSTVWVNGKEAGHRPYGYSSFTYDITDMLNPAGEDNIIAVKCDNSLQPNSRWYAGCGIYRNVRLVVTAPLFVAYNGTFVTTPVINDKQATVDIAVTLTNSTDAEQKAVLRNSITDAAGKKVSGGNMEVTVPANSSHDFTMQLKVANPELWDTERPYLYTAVTTIAQDGKITDDYTTRFGIRSFEFTADKGLLLNGKHVKILGVCQHHDMGALGAAVHRRALERQLEILRSFGCNGIRTSHNPPTPELLDLCDSMGFIVMDEAFDMWKLPKTQYDYSLYFDQWHERDLSDFIRRDRNHPSVFMWSLGNEIEEQNSGWGSAEERTRLTQERQDMTRALAGIVRKLDTTRPLTAGCNYSEPINNLLNSGALDITGFNYSHRLYDSLPIWFPNRPMIASETTSSTQSRGYYVNPSDSTNIGLPKYDTVPHQLSAYDHSYVDWGAAHEMGWLAVRDRDFMSGIYIWTGFDYIGEPTPYKFPSRSSYFGIVDLCGFPKDAYYMYRSEWTGQTTLHLFPHWNWNEGDKIDLWAYYNNADEVELLVNGRSYGKQSKTSDRLHCIWRGVEFTPGEITAISYKDGKEVARDTRKTAGEAVKTVLSADRQTIKADGYDLSYITIDAQDKDSLFAPLAMNQLSFSIEGAGELVGVDNGNAAGSECLKGNKMKLFNGKALAIVRSLKGEKGNITLTVDGEGLGQSKVTIKAE